MTPQEEREWWGGGHPMTPQEVLAQALRSIGDDVRRLSSERLAAAILDALPEGAYLVVPPPNTRLILADEDLLASWGTRTAEGLAITAEWGEQKPEGWYEPRFTMHSDDDLAADQRGAGAKQERKRLRELIDADLVEGDPSDYWDQQQVYMWVMDVILADPKDER